MNKLFVYGIFLGKGMRDEYGMSNSRYATVKDYVTVARDRRGHIVEAVESRGRGHVLTGLIVDVAPYSYVRGADGVEAWDNWAALDELESAYDRVEIVTTDNERAWMYVARSRDGQAEQA